MENFRLPQAVKNQTPEEIAAINSHANANSLLDELLGDLRLKNDAALCRALDQPPPVVSKIRHGKLAIGPALLISIHEISGKPIVYLKQRLGIPSLGRHPNAV